METNTRILSFEFEYFEPGNLKETLELLSRFGEKARLIAGGTDLLVKMKRELLHPEVLISLSRVSELRFIKDGNDSIRIGAGTTLSELEHNPEIGESLSALFEAVRSMGAPAIRNMGTIGGNLGNASPAADTAPPLLAFGAQLRLASLRGERVVPVEDFFLSPGKTILSPDELILEIIIPRPSLNSGSAFLKLGRVSYDMAKISVAVFLEREGERCRTCRVAFGSVAPTPVRAPSVEKLLEEEILSKETIERACANPPEEINPIDDVRSTREYRLAVSPVILEETLKAAWKRSGGAL